MSTATIGLTLNDFKSAFREANLARGRSAAAACETRPALRVALLYREELRLPLRSEGLRILSGKAWVTFGGRDFFLGCGDRLDLPGPRNGAIISAVGGDALLFEVT